MQILNTDSKECTDSKLLPAEHHHFIDCPGASWGRSLAEARLDEPEHLVVGDGGERLLGNGPDLKENHAIAPDITLWGVALVEQSLWELAGTLQLINTMEVSIRTLRG